MCEELIVRHASPTLAGLKTGSLFTCPFEGQQAMHRCLRCWNHALAPKGLRVLPLRWQNGRALVYLYRPARLARDLQCPEARALLAPRGYCCEDPTRCLGRLMQRLREQGDIIPDEEAEAALLDVDEKAEQAHFHNVLERALGELSVVQGAVLRHRFTRKHTRKETAEALHITAEEVRREEAKALQLLRGKPAVWALKKETLETAAYHGTGWFSWYFEQGSVEERLVECKRYWGY